MTRKLWKEEGDLEAGIDDLQRNHSITDHGSRERNEPNILDQVARSSASHFTRLKSNHAIQQNGEEKVGFFSQLHELIHHP